MVAGSKWSWELSVLSTCLRKAFKKINRLALLFSKMLMLLHLAVNPYEILFGWKIVKVFEEVLLIARANYVCVWIEIQLIQLNTVKPMYLKLLCFWNLFFAKNFHIFSQTFFCDFVFCILFFYCLRISSIIYTSSTYRCRSSKSLFWIDFTNTTYVFFQFTCKNIRILRENFVHFVPFRNCFLNWP